MQSHCATKEDIPLINSLIRHSVSYWKYKKEDIDTYMKKYGITENFYEKGHIFKTYDEENWIGIYALTLNEEEQLKLSHFYIEPAKIGHGYGKEMWALCKKTVHDVYKAKEFTFNSDPGANGFYDKMGCQKIGEFASRTLTGMTIHTYKAFVEEKRRD